MSVLTGTSEDETGMLSGLNTTGHGIGDALLVAGALAGVASLFALAILPFVTSFLPKLRLCRGRAGRLAVSRGDCVKIRLVNKRSPTNRCTTHSTFTGWAAS